MYELPITLKMNEKCECPKDRWVIMILALLIKEEKLEEAQFRVIQM